MGQSSCPLDNGDIQYVRIFLRFLSSSETVSFLVYIMFILKSIGRQERLDNLALSL